MLRIIITLAFLSSFKNDFLCLKTVYVHSSYLPTVDNNSLPYFADNPQNYTVKVNDTVTLKCSVKNIGNRTVSWISKRDLAILTSNVFVYTSSERFSVLQHSDNWDLRIRSLTEKDQGLYECQVNTEPKIYFPIFLEVLNDTDDARDANYKVNIKHEGKVPRVKILSPSQNKVLEIAKGSTISLLCTVNLQASLIVWHHNDTIVDFQRGGINLENEKTSEGTTSRLLLTKANFKDSGIYSCSAQLTSIAFSQSVPSTILPDSISVRVIERR